MPFQERGMQKKMPLMVMVNGDNYGLDEYVSIHTFSRPNRNKMG